MKPLQSIPNRFHQFLTPFQVVFLTVSSYLPLMLWFYPYTAIHYARFDGQWAILGMLAVGLAAAMVQGALNERFPDQFGIDFIYAVYGKAIGAVLNAVYIVCYLVFVAATLRVFEVLIKGLFWPNTPISVFTFVMLIASVSGAYCGIETLARISAVFNPLIVFGFVATCLTALTQMSWYGVPLAVDRLDRTLLAMYHLMPLYLGFNFYLMLSPYYKHTKRSMWYPVIAVLVSSLIIVAGFLSVVLMIGWELSEMVQWSLPYLFQIIRLEGFFIERVGVSMIILSTFFHIMFLANHLWGISVAGCRLFRKSDDAFRVALFPVAVVIGIGSNLFTDEQSLLNFIMVWLPPVAWGLILGIPLLTLLLAWMTGKRGKRKSASSNSPSSP